MANYLRISVTDRCNLRCMYCLPFEQIGYIPHEQILRYEEIVRLVRLLVPLGIRKVRLTGGEPLVRLGLEDLVAMLRGVEGIEEICLTTNGTLLAQKAESLKQAGLDRVNISLDSLDPLVYEQMTGFDLLPQVWEGVEEARRVGLTPVKLDVLIFRGINDNQIDKFVELTVDEDIEVRFIEFFETNRTIARLKSKAVLNPEIRQRIESKFGSLVPVGSSIASGPAQSFSLPNAKGRIGFISSESEPFCSTCNRLRLSSHGQLFPCLFDSTALDVRALLRGDNEDEQITEELKNLIVSKKQFVRDQEKQADFRMSAIGG